MSLPGRYADATGIERDCTLRFTSLDDIEILVDVAPNPHARMICRVPGLGVLIGRAGVLTATSVRLDLDAGVQQRRKLAARIGWHREPDGPDRREATRIVPTKADVVVIWGGVESVGRLRDVSVGGAAVDVLPRPPLGFPVTLGLRRATVVRHTDAGIGVSFALPLGPADVTEDVVL